MAEVVVGVLLFLLGLRLTLYPHCARGALLLSLWLRDAALAPLIAFACYVLDLILIFLFAGVELSERVKLKWRGIINARLKGEDPPCSFKDMIDDAALLKIALQRLTFRLKGVWNGP
jgi:hypothetical protein